MSINENIQEMETLFQQLDEEESQEKEKLILQIKKLKESKSSLKIMEIWLNCEKSYKKVTLDKMRKIKQFLNKIDRFGIHTICRLVDPVSNVKSGYVIKYHNHSHLITLEIVNQLRRRFPTLRDAFFRIYPLSKPIYEVNKR